MSGGASITPAEALGAAVRKNVHLLAGAPAITRFDEMESRESADHSREERLIRQEAVADMVNWIWEGGIVDLKRAVKRLVTFTRLYRPELVLNVTCEEAAALFGQGKAAESARAVIVEETLKGAGYHYTKLPSLKSESACDKMAKAQRGNKHRARSVKKRKP